MPLTTSRLRRTFAIAGLPVRATARSVALLVPSAEPRDTRADRARAANAADTRRVLADLKGGAQKVGQLLSTVDALLPQDPDASWQQAMQSLQEDAAGLPFPRSSRSWPPSSAPVGATASGASTRSRSRPPASDRSTARRGRTGARSP